MLVRLDDCSNLEEINKKSKQFLGSGQGGEVFRYNEHDVIKLLFEDNSLTEINTDYFIEHVSSNLLVSPKRKVFDQNQNFVGYIASYIEQNNNGITFIDTNTFLYNLSKLLDEIHKELSKNEIAIFDGINFLVGDNGVIYLSDFDMYKTPFSEKHLLYSIKGDYESYNNRQFDALVYYMLKQQICRENGYSTSDIKNIPIETEFSDSLEYVRKKVLKYPTIYEFSKAFGYK